MRCVIIVYLETVADTRSLVLIPELVHWTLHLLTVAATDNVLGRIHVWKTRSLIGCTAWIV